MTAEPAEGKRTALDWAQMSSLEAALTLARGGLHVFPVDHPELPHCAGIGKEHDPETCDQRGKHPAVAFTMASTTNEKMITTWFTGAPRNIGIHCGKSNLVVIDEDKLGELQRYADEHRAAIPPTFVVATAKGRHYYFAARADHPLGNVEGAFRDYNINVRGTNGYVVAPGSMHASGVVYTVEVALPPAPIPDWVIDGIRRTNGAADNAGGGYARPRPAGGVGFELPDVIKDGSRDGTLFSYAASLRARRVPLGEAEVLMQAAWERCEQPPTASHPYTREEALGKLRGAYDRYAEGTSAEYRRESPPAAPPDLELVLPVEFYRARTKLWAIRQYAHSRGAPADPTLYAVLAQISGMVPHRCRLETGIGSRLGASLNLSVANVGPPGSGKSKSASVAKDIYLPTIPDFAGGLPLGTGEGIVEAFMGWEERDTDEVYLRDGKGGNKGEPKKKWVRCQVRHNASIEVDEGEAFNKLASRDGSTLGSTIRTAWYGGTVGNQNADPNRRRVLPEGSYALGLFIGFQPDTVLPLLRDDAAGTPQRFIYCWAIDPFRSLDARSDLLPQLFVVKAEKLSLASSIADEVKQQDLVNGNGTTAVPRLDAHRNLTKLKLAALLALLEKRDLVAEEDWRLAGIMWEVSCRVRDYALAAGQVTEARERHTRNVHNADREGMAEVARQQVRDASAKVVRIARLVGKHVHDPATPARTVGEVNRRLKSIERLCLTEALDYAASEGWVEVDGNQVTPGPSRPA